MNGNRQKLKYLVINGQTKTRINICMVVVDHNDHMVVVDVDLDNILLHDVVVEQLRESLRSRLMVHEIHHEHHTEIIME